MTRLHGRAALIVGINYWPEPTGIAPYTTALAEHLVAGGASVEVLAGLPCYPSWRVPAQYRRRLRFCEERNGVTIRRLTHVVPRRQDALRRGAYELSFLTHAALCRPRVRPDLVIGVTPALGGAVAAALLARRYGARLMIIVQDLLGQAATQTGIAGGSLVAGPVRGLESFALRRADTVAVVTDAFRPQLSAYGVAGERVHTVPNWSQISASTADRAVTRASLGWDRGQFVVLHSGNMGLKQGLGSVIEAARLTRGRTDLRWVLMGEGSQLPALQEQARGLPNLEFLPLCEQERYRDVLAAADVLLLNERPGVREMSLPSKLTSYFVSSRPVVAAVGADGASARELGRAGISSLAPPGDPAALVAVVDRVAAAPGAYAAQAEAAARYAREHLGSRAALRRLEDALVGSAPTGG